MQEHSSYFTNNSEPFLPQERVCSPQYNTWSPRSKSPLPSPSSSSSSSSPRPSLHVLLKNQRQLLNDADADVLLRLSSIAMDQNSHLARQSFLTPQPSMQQSFRRRHQEQQHVVQHSMSCPLPRNSGDIIQDFKDKTHETPPSMDSAVILMLGASGQTSYYDLTDTEVSENPSPDLYHHFDRYDHVAVRTPTSINKALHTSLAPIPANSMGNSDDVKSKSQKVQCSNMPLPQSATSSLPVSILRQLSQENESSPNRSSRVEQSTASTQVATSALMSLEEMTQLLKNINIEESYSNSELNTLQNRQEPIFESLARDDDEGLDDIFDEGRSCYEELSETEYGSAHDEESLSLHQLSPEWNKNNRNEYYDESTGFLLEASLHSCASSVTWYEGSSIEEVSVTDDDFDDDDDNEANSQLGDSIWS